MEVEEPVDQLSLGAVSNGEGLEQVEVKLFGGEGGEVKARLGRRGNCGRAFIGAFGSVHRASYSFISVPVFQYAVNRLRP